MTKPLFTALLMLPQGYVCQFKVYSAGFLFWEFVNENNGLCIHLFYTEDIGYRGTVLPVFCNSVQKDNLLCQAIFELEDFYGNR
jgi:hypothetical protein